jgi:hypothetical protein
MMSCLKKKLRERSIYNSYKNKILRNKCNQKSGTGITEGYEILMEETG